MKILVINCGSSTLKFKLIDTKKNHKSLCEELIEGTSYTSAVKSALKKLIKSKTIKNLKDIDAIGHRVVHGGEKYIKTTKITPPVIKEIKRLFPLAPLHNPANLEGILACKKIFPNIPQYAVFDTAFYQTIPQKAFLYGLPYELYTKHKIRRYGFHGISHKYVVNEAIKILKNKNAKIVSCHLGNGSSITASVGGKAIDTSMGFTPLEGVIMGTRAGNLDPGIILFLQEKLKMSPQKITHLLNHESGLKGISKISSDMRKIYAKSLKKDAPALLAIDLLAYHTAKYIGAYTAAMNGLDSIVFTAGIGENAFYIRKKICDYLKNWLKIKPKILVIKTNEEKQIAKEISY